MPKISLEKLARRLSALEELVARLVHAEPKGGRFKDWRRAAGMFAGHELMKKIERRE